MLLFPRCTVVNYCIGSKIDEGRRENHTYKQGKRFTIKKNRNIHIMTLKGESINGMCLGVEERPGTQVPDLSALGDSLQASLTYMPEPFLPADLLGGRMPVPRPIPAASHVEGQKDGSPAAGDPGRFKVVLVRTEGGDIREVEMEEIYCAKSEYRHAKFWRKALPVPGLVFDVALILCIKGVIPVGESGSGGND